MNNPDPEQGFKPNREQRRHPNSPASTADEPAAQPRVMTLAELSGYSRISRSGIYRAIATGDLRTFKAGRRRLVTYEAADAWLDGLIAEAG